MFDYEYHFDALMDAIEEISLTVEERESAVRNSMEFIMNSYSRDYAVTRKKRTGRYYEWSKTTTQQKAS